MNPQKDAPTESETTEDGHHETLQVAFCCIGIHWLRKEVWLVVPGTMEF